MAKIEHSALTKGQRVWYEYSKAPYGPTGPFTIMHFFGDHTGTNVRLKPVRVGAEVRNVSLATDDDFGEPIFYDSEPKP